MRTIIQLGLLSTLVALFCACETDVDKNPPAILDFQVNGNEEDSVSVDAGTNVQFSARLEDDDELREMRFAISLNETKYVYPSEFPSRVVIIDVFDSEYDFGQVVNFPDTVPASTWQVELSTFDGNGNFVEVTKEMTVQNSFLPAIKVDSIFPSLSVSSNTELQLADTLDFFGDVAGFANLSRVALELQLVETGETVWQIEEMPIATSFSFQSFSQLLILPTELEFGDYFLDLVAEDAEGYESRIRYDVSFEED
ncbi:hypothetical protein [Halocola ammonii]